MADQLSDTTLVTTNNPGEFIITAKDFTPAGKSEEFKVAIPQDPIWAKRMLTAVLLKRTTWKNFDMPSIITATLYAEALGLDILQGDVYSAEGGRFSTTAGAKIKHGMASGRIVGYKVEFLNEDEGAVEDFQWKTERDSGTDRFPNYHCRVTVWVKDFKEPIVYETTLREWYQGRNPNWRQRPKYMLRRNALGKAFEEVAPMGVEADEAPPIEVFAPPVKAAAASALAPELSKEE